MRAIFECDSIFIGDKDDDQNLDVSIKNIRVFGGTWPLTRVGDVDFEVPTSVIVDMAEGLAANIEMPALARWVVDGLNKMTHQFQYLTEAYLEKFPVMPEQVFLPPAYKGE